MDVRTITIFTMALLCAIAPLELSQVAFALVGALAYALVQALQLPIQRASLLAAGGKPGKTRIHPVGCGGAEPCKAAPLRRPAAEGGQAAGPPARPCYRQPSTQPVASPVFMSSGFEAEVNELLRRISPTAECERVVQQLAKAVKQILRRSIPEAEVVGIASGELVRGTAFGVAVPEVDIIVNVSPHILASHLQGRLSQRSTAAPQLDERKLQKSAIRACTDRLVSSGNFKFRRSAFRSQEPKVTLLAPASLGIYSESIPIDFSVNSSTPLYNAALLTACGQMEPRAKELITLIKRWAKDRGVCHAAKGHLSPYAWTLLAIYFLQVGVPQEGPLLPPLKDFELSSTLAGGAGIPNVENQPRQQWSPLAGGVDKRSVGQLFQGFVRFYASDFNWRNEAVSVRLGRRAPPDLGLPLHIVLHDDGVTTEVALTIESPFAPLQNLGDCATAGSVARLRAELARAAALCARGAPLGELLEPWAPPERDGEEEPPPGGCDCGVAEERDRREARGGGAGAAATGAGGRARSAKAAAQVVCPLVQQPGAAAEVVAHPWRTAGRQAAGGGGGGGGRGRQEGRLFAAPPGPTTPQL